ncbi:MAG TPA: hypothetical protein VL221_04605 [Bacteroidota bacterium]|nr:hypothetical protein [Bacteroidota bacterium]
MTTTSILRRTALLAALAAVLAGSARAQARFEQSLSISGGLYAASGFGNNFYTSARYDYFIPGTRWFIDGSLGVGSLTSNVIGSVTKAQIFTSNNLVTYEFAAAFDYAPGGAMPFLLFGVGGVREGEETHFAAVIGIGKRIPLPGLLGSNALGFRYDIRDQIFSQVINNSNPFVVHNITATLGLQIYF